MILFEPGWLGRGIQTVALLSAMALTPDVHVKDQWDALLRRLRKQGRSRPVRHGRNLFSTGEIDLYSWLDAGVVAEINELTWRTGHQHKAEGELKQLSKLFSAKYLQDLHAAMMELG
jgi:hypothetical protein